MEDTHKKRFFFSGRTTKGVGRGTPPTTKQKITFGEWRKYYFMKYNILVQTFTSLLVRKQYLQKKNFSPKIGEEKKIVKIRFRLL